MTITLHYSRSAMFVLFTCDVSYGIGNTYIVILCIGNRYGRVAHMDMDIGTNQFV